MSGRPLAELAREITHGAVRLSAATAAWLMLVAEFDERDGWAGSGTRSCAHWLSWQCGLGMGAAREHVRVARALQVLPLTRAAFVEGRICYAEARALTRVAEPATGAGLLDFALTATASQTERALREAEGPIGWTSGPSPSGGSSTTGGTTTACRCCAHGCHQKKVPTS